MAYITPADWLLMYNPKTLGDLCSTSGASVPAANMPTNPQALYFLDAASGELASACLVAELYSQDDLTAIAGTAGVSQNFFKSMVGKIALRLALENKPEKYKGWLETLSESIDKSLDQLRQGKRLFISPLDQDEQPEGGLVACTGMSTAKIINRNSLPQRVRNFYPGTEQRQPLNRQHGGF